MHHALDMAETVEKSRVKEFLSRFASDHQYGWQQELSRRTGVAQDVLSKLYAGIRGPGVKTLAALTKGMGLPPAFFSDPSIGKASEYARFVGVSASVRATAHATATITAVHDDPLSTWDRFLLMPEAQKLSQEALLHAKALKGHGGATAEMLLQAARGFDAGRKSAESGDLVTGTRPIFREEVPAGKRALAPARKR